MTFVRAVPVEMAPVTQRKNAKIEMAKSKAHVRTDSAFVA